MAKFEYTARNIKGELETSTIEAPSPEAAVLLLQNQRLIVTSIGPSGGGGRLTFKRIEEWVMPLLNRVKNQELVLFTQQLAVLIQAKVPLVQSLKVMAKQTKNPYFAGIIDSIAAEVYAGSTFSKTLSKYPPVFSDFYVFMVKSGEISGRLEETLTYLSTYLNRQYLLTSKARGAMIYPAFIVSAFIIIGAVMLIFVVPNLTAVLVESGQELPLVTRMLIGASDIAKSWGWLVLIVLVFGFYFAQASVRRSAEARRVYDGLKLRIPVFGELLKKIYLARMAETLSTLGSAGISISQALEITGDVVGNLVYKNIIAEANDSVRKGGNINTVFAHYPDAVLPMVTQMVAIGEQTGKMDMVLKQITIFFTEEVNRAFDNIVNLIEPILIVVLGGGVGILVAAILLPIYNLVNAF